MRLTWTKKLTNKLNIAHIARKKKLKQTNTSAHFVQYKFKIHVGSPEGIRMTTEERIWKEMSFKSGVKGRESDRL